MGAGFAKSGFGAISYHVKTAGTIALISNDNPTLVSCVDNEKFEFQEDDLVVFVEVHGMSGLNHRKPMKIRNARVLHLDVKPKTLLLYMMGGCRNICFIETNVGNRSKRRRYLSEIVNEKISEGMLKEVSASKQICDAVQAKAGQEKNHGDIHSAAVDLRGKAYDVLRQNDARF